MLTDSDERFDQWKNSNNFHEFHFQNLHKQLNFLFVFFKWINFRIQHFINYIWICFVIVNSSQFHDIIFICGCPALAFFVGIRTLPISSISFLPFIIISVISLVYQYCSSFSGNCVTLDFLYIVQIWNVEGKMNE